MFGRYPGIGPIPAEDSRISTPLKPTALIIGQITQPLSQLYRLNLNIAQLKLNREVAQEELRARQHEIVQNVKHAYFAILQSQSALRSADETVKEP